MGPSFCVGADVGHVAEAGHASHTDGGTDADAHGPDGRGHAVARLRAEDQQSYRGAVAGLAKHFARSPDTLETLTEAELRVFFLELVTTRQVSRSTLMVYRSGIRFLYEVTLQRSWPVFDLVRPAKRHTLPNVLAVAEVHQLLTAVRDAQARMTLTLTSACALPGTRWCAGARRGHVAACGWAPSGAGARVVRRISRALSDAVQAPAATGRRAARRLEDAVGGVCEAHLQGADLVLRYLARYVHRTAITDARIVRVDAHTVTFRYQGATARAWRTMTLQGDDFLRRFLQHVLPRGFHKVRYYGFWRARASATRMQLQQQLAPVSRVALAPPASHVPLVPREPICTQCGHGHLYRTRRRVRTPDVRALAQPP